MDTTKFTAFIRELIDNPTLTVTDLAVAAGISKGAASKYLKMIKSYLNKRDFFPISDEDYEQLLDAMKARERAVLDDEDEEEDEKEEEDMITVKAYDEEKKVKRSNNEDNTNNDEGDELLPDDAKVFKDVLMMTTTLGAGEIKKMVQQYVKYRDLINKDPTLLHNMLNGKLGHYRANLVMNSLQKVLGLTGFDPDLSPSPPPPPPPSYPYPTYYYQNTNKDKEWFKDLIEKTVIAKAIASSSSTSIEDLLKIMQLIKKEDTVPITIRAEDKEATVNVPSSVAPLLILQQKDNSKDNSLVEAIKVVTSITEPLFKLLANNTSNNKDDTSKEFYKELLELYKSEKKDPLELIKTLRDTLPELFEPPPETLEVAKLKMEHDTKIQELAMQLEKWRAEREDAREERRMQIEQMNKYADVASQLLSQALPPIAQAIAQGASQANKTTNTNMNNAVSTTPQIATDSRNSNTAANDTSIVPSSSQQQQSIPDFDNMTDEELMQYNAQLYNTGKRLEEAQRRFNAIVSKLNAVLAKRGKLLNNNNNTNTNNTNNNTNQNDNQQQADTASSITTEATTAVETNEAIVNDNRIDVPLD